MTKRQKAYKEYFDYFAKNPNYLWFCKDPSERHAEISYLAQNIYPHLVTEVQFNFFKEERITQLNPDAMYRLNEISKSEVEYRRKYKWVI